MCVGKSLTAEEQPFPLPPVKSFILSKYYRPRYSLQRHGRVLCRSFSCRCPPAACHALPSRAFPGCGGAVNKEIDDKVVEERQLDRTARHEWQRARSAFAAKNGAPSSALAVPGCAAKPLQRGERSLRLMRGISIRFLACVLKVRFPLFRVVA